MTKETVKWNSRGKGTRGRDLVACNFRSQIVFFLLGIVFCLAVFCAENGYAEDANVLWQDDFDSFKSTTVATNGWVLNGISAESAKGELFLREVGASGFGTMTRELILPAASLENARYLQIGIKGIEDIENPLSVDGVDCILYSGINTLNISGFSKLNNKIKITLRLKGPKGDKPGGWVKIDWIKLVKTPYSGITIDRDAERNLVFRYHSKVLLPEKTLPFQCFASKDKLWLCEWSKGPLALTSVDGAIVYTLKIPANELSVKAPISKNTRTIDAQLVVSAEIGRDLTRGFSSFRIPVTINSKAKAPKEKAKTPLTRQYRSLWEERTTGENLALEREFKFPVKPKYRLTVRDGKDEWNLTDGKLAKRLDDRIWFSADAVGWYMLTGPINLLVDLGKVHPVGKIVVRILCGAEQGNLRGPAKIAVAVSKDGNNYFRASSLTQLMTGEKEQCDWKRYYYLAENGKSFVYPFELSVEADTRYVGLTITGATGAIFMDELAIIKATPAEKAVTGYNAAYTPANKVGFTTDGIQFGPLKNELVISTNVNAPSIFQSHDLRQTEKREAKVRWVVELPPEITVLKTKSYKPPYPVREEFVENGENRVRWTLKETKAVRERGFGPIYFQLRKGAKTPNDATAVFYALSDGSETNKERVPIRFITIPKVPKLKRLHNSLAWMGLGASLAWPDFLDAWECIGFNCISSFPRYLKRGKDGIPYLKPEQKKLLDAARSRGFKVVMNESPFHVMVKKHKPGSEVFSQIPSGKSKSACPSYRGKYYQKELERVRRNVEVSKPDYVFWDVEIWYHGAKEASKCSRCKAGCERSGKPLEEYLTDMGRELNRDLYQAVKNGIKPGEKMPIVGSYNRQPLRPIYQFVGDFKKCYPDYWKLAMPSLYVVGRAKDVHDNIRGNYKLMGCKKIIPWLTAGCYGEFPSKNIEAMVLETLMNGGSGTTYYWFGDFDTPDDYYYHAKAYAQIAPYEDLVADGEVLDLSGDNPGMTYSALRKNGEMLILVGNYSKTKKTETNITLPFKKVDVVKDLRSGKELKSNETLKLTVPTGDIRLIYVEGK